MLKLVVVTQWCRKPAKCPAFEPSSLFIFNKPIQRCNFFYWQVFFRRVKETNETQARFFYNAVSNRFTYPLLVYLY